MHQIHPLYLYLALKYITGEIKYGDELKIERRDFPPWETVIMSILFPPFALEDQILWKINRILISTRGKEYEVNKSELKKIPRYKELVEYLFIKYKLSKETVDKAGLYIYFEATLEFTKYLNGVLSKYSAIYVNDTIGVTASNSYSFEKQLNIFKTYVDKISNVQNIKHFEIDIQDLYKTADNDKKKYSMDFYSFMLALYYAKCINISSVTYPFKRGSTRLYKYGMSIGIVDLNGLNLITIRERLGLPEVKKSFFVLPQDQKYFYDHDTKALIFQLSGGSSDQFDFSRAKISRKVFEAFWNLWKKNNNGEYSRDEVCAMYKKLHNEPILPARVGEIVSNIRSTIINPKILIKDKLEWGFDQDKQCWIFRIFA
jgi:hypothetical protein